MYVCTYICMYVCMYVCIDIDNLFDTFQIPGNFLYDQIVRKLLNKKARENGLVHWY